MLMLSTFIQSSLLHRSCFYSTVGTRQIHCLGPSNSNIDWFSGSPEARLSQEIVFDSHGPLKKKEKEVFSSVRRMLGLVGLIRFLPRLFLHEQSLAYFSGTFILPIPNPYDQGYNSFSHLHLTYAAIRPPHSYFATSTCNYLFICSRPVHSHLKYSHSYIIIPSSIPQQVIKPSAENLCLQKFVCTKAKRDLKIMTMERTTSVSLIAAISSSYY